MRYLNKRGQKWLKVVHVVFAAVWLGGGLSLTLLAWLAEPASGDELYAFQRAMQIVDDLVIIPGAIGGLVTGLIYSVATRWGFFRHRWITVKWVLTVGQALLGTFFLGPWLNANVEIARTERLAALDNPSFLYNQQMNTILGTIQVSLIVALVAISIIRPWPGGRRKEQPASETAQSPSGAS